MSWKVATSPSFTTLDRGSRLPTPCDSSAITGEMVDYEISPQEAQHMLSATEGEKPILLDVREPGEYAAEHIAGALPHPLSAFDAAFSSTDMSTF